MQNVVLLKLLSQKKPLPTERPFEVIEIQRSGNRPVKAKVLLIAWSHKSWIINSRLLIALLTLSNVLLILLTPFQTVRSNCSFHWRFSLKSMYQTENRFCRICIFLDLSCSADQSSWSLSMTYKSGWTWVYQLQECRLRGCERLLRADFTFFDSFWATPVCSKF